MILVPGTSLLNNELMGFAYFMFLMYLFLGISIIADIFMEAIECITSSEREQEFVDEEGKVSLYMVKVWNPTIANLTLMALGSSAPEILLSVIEALKSLGEPSGELGPSSIVGSGAFNLLCISGISIIAVDEPKKIYDLGVYSCTAFFSIFAYAWMYFCLELNTPDYVTPMEAWLTLLYFVILVSMAFGFDKLQQNKDKKQDDKASKEKKIEEIRLKSKKNHIINLSRVHTKVTVINIARGILNGETEAIKPEESEEIKSHFRCLLGLADGFDLSKISADQLLKVLEPDSLLERFAAKKANKVGKNNEFLTIKADIKGQIENDSGNKKVEDLNEYIGFKCLHYSVTESAGVAVVTVVKKVVNNSLTFGVRTVKE